MTIKTSYLYFIAFAVGLISIFIVKYDVGFIYSRQALALHIFSVFLIFILWFFSLFSEKKALKIVNYQGLLIIFILACISRLVLLVDYPFVSVGDELRDGGLDSLAISTGTIKNLFEYGRYNAHGLIIPTLMTPFYRILHASVLVYRLPAALLGIIDVSLFYILLSVLTKNKFASFLGSLALISLPLHLFYSRTEVTVILSSCFSTAILTTVFILLKRKPTKMIDYVFLGTLLGFTFNFHASVKALALLVLFTVIIFNLVERVFKRLKTGVLASRLFLLGLFVIIGFGPRMLFTSSVEFFNLSRLPQTDFLNWQTIQEVAEKYQKSLLVWVKEPTNAWYPDHQPILSLPLFILFILGIGVSLFKKDRFLVSVVLITLVLHFTNSAATDILNGDHRLSPLFPIGVLFVGLGIAFIFERIKINWYQYLATGLLTGFLLYQTAGFFLLQPANKNRKIGDYLAMHTISFLNQKKQLFGPGKEIIFALSPLNYQQFNYLHYQEQRAFFFPENLISLESGPEIKDNEIYIKDVKNKMQGKSAAIDCVGASYHCPLDYRGSINIFY
ncbi:hypothetical protein KJ965_02875 [Patescibacteria group bacterium]|nr:hypothetical protein [Patescibacteria group bacterium]